MTFTIKKSILNLQQPVFVLIFYLLLILKAEFVCKKKQTTYSDLCFSLHFVLYNKRTKSNINNQNNSAAIRDKFPVSTNSNQLYHHNSIQLLEVFPR